MTLGAQRGALVFAAVLGSLANAGCTVWNKVDVCEREPGAIEDVNLRNENDQSFSGADHLIPASEGTWLTVWTSGLSGSGAARRDLRIARLDAEGAPLHTCGEQGEFTVVEATPDADSESMLYTPSLVAPRNGDDTPLLFWGSDDGQTTTLFGEELSNQGCHPINSQPFVVAQQAGVCSTFPGRSQAEAQTCLLPFRAAALDTSENGGAQFVLVWREDHYGSAGATMARVLEYGLDEKFLATASSPRGDAVPLFQGSREPLSFDLVGLDDGKWAMAWIELGTTTQTAWIQLWNDRLEQLTQPVLLDEGTIPDTRILDVARVGDDVGVAFVVAGGVHATIASGRDGHALAQREIQRSSQTDWTRVGADTNGNIVLAWSEANHVLAGLFDRSLSPKFNNQACDNEPFVVDGATGSAGREDLAFDQHGGLLMTWTSSGAGGDDRSGTAVRSRYFTSGALKP